MSKAQPCPPELADGLLELLKGQPESLVPWPHQTSPAHPSFRFATARATFCLICRYLSTATESHKLTNPDRTQLDGSLYLWCPSSDLGITNSSVLLHVYI